MTSAFAAINLQKYSMYMTADKAVAGKTVDVTLALKNDKAVASWEAVVALPEGITLASAEVAGTRTPEGYTITTSTEGNVVTLFCEGEEGTALTGQDGVIATLTLNVASTVAEGDYTIKMNSMTATDETGKAWKRVEWDTQELTLTVEAPAGIKGDVNGDGTVTVADIVAVQNIMADPSLETPASDVNSDGSITVADIVSIQNIMAGVE